MKRKYQEIVDHYENCLDKYGDNHLGVDWPKKEDADKRYKIMLDIIRFNEQNPNRVSLLDFGCGTAHLNEFIIKNSYTNIAYSGLDISPKFINVARKKFSNVSFYCGDILDHGFSFPLHDYVIINGVFTEKRNLAFNDMWDYFTDTLKAIYQKSNKGIAFNVMSKNVDWERDDLFHVSLDLLSKYLCENLTRNFVIRNDYGLYEYTTYLYK